MEYRCRSTASYMETPIVVGILRPRHDGHSNAADLAYGQHQPVETTVGFADLNNNQHFYTISE